MADNKPDPVTPPRKPLVFPADWIDKTAEHAGTIFGIVGAPKPPKAKPK